jgi:beta-ketoacyl-acyl-carrier-protein synthase II
MGDAEVSASERVVITGMGAITPNGLDVPSTWAGVSKGQSGIGPITRFDCSDYGVKIAGEAHGFDPLTFMSAKQARRADRMTQLALGAALEAIGHSGLAVDSSNAFDVGVFVGCGAGGIETYLREKEQLDRRGPRGLTPMLIPKIVTDSASVQISAAFGARGPTLGFSSACATSLDAIGHAFHLLRRGDAHAMIAGGTEAAVNELGIGGFDRMGALSRHDDDPVAASRPFDAERGGFVLSEGAVVVVLETLSHALGRGAEVLAEVLSYASTSDGAHITQPDPEGSGGIECMRRTLARAGRSPEEIGYIAAHAPGTPVGDPIEATAIRSVLGSRAQEVPVSGTKGATGHLLGAAGALAIALTTCALRARLLPPTVNLRSPGDGCQLLHVTGEALASDATLALIPSYGFGGHNSCIALARDAN